jgi:succinoglycan biosynthesis protein ExoL
MLVSGLQILYLVHDCADAAVARRVAMLRDGGAQVTVAGFRRAAKPLFEVAGCRAVDFGRTYNRRFAHRAWSVLREAALLSRHRVLFQSAHVVIARNLEMLAIAARGRELCERPPVMVYESLDIHRLLWDRGALGATLRALEGRLAHKAAAAITCSPAYISRYFEPLSHVHLPFRLVENKVYLPALAEPRRRVPRRAGPPWRIGWFGALHCAKSFAILSRLANESRGQIEVVLRGRPAYDELPAFDRVVADTPTLAYLGPYRNPEDLASIYGDVHFTWAIDMYDEGKNSAWLLPNRLYEGGLYGGVPLALADVETGRFLARLGIGVGLEAPLEDALKSFLANLTPDLYGKLAQAAAAIPAATWLCSREECRDLVVWLSGLAEKRLSHHREAA